MYPQGLGATITLQFCSFNSFWGRVIPWFTQAPDGVGHVDIVTDDGDLLGAQHEAMGGCKPGVWIRPASYVKESGGKRIIRATFGVTSKQKQRFWDFASMQIGKPYDVTSIKGFMAGRNWRDDKAWFCSELAAAALEAAVVFKESLASPVLKRLMLDDYLVRKSVLVLTSKSYVVSPINYTRQLYQLFIGGKRDAIHFNHFSPPGAAASTFSHVKSGPYARSIISHITSHMAGVISTGTHRQPAAARRCSIASDAASVPVSAGHSVDIS